MKTTEHKKQMRADIKYVREMLRQIEAAIKADDYATVIELSNEASCSAVEIMQQASEASGLRTL